MQREGDPVDRVGVPAHWDLPEDWIAGPPRDRAGRLKGLDEFPEPELADRARQLRDQDRRARAFSTPPPTPPLKRTVRPRRRPLRWRD